MMRWLIIGMLGLSAVPALAAEPLPRTLIALYDSREEASPRTTQTHRFLEMPANHLGYDVRYYSITETLPELRKDVAGVVIWFNNGVEVPDADSYLSWLERAQAAGKKILIIENAGIGETLRRKPDVVARWNGVLASLGLQDENRWQSITHGARVTRQDAAMVGFERALGPVLPAFTPMRLAGARATSYLSIAYREGQDTLSHEAVVTGPGGGYIAEDYALFHVVQDDASKIRQWIVNPFLFLKQALGAPLAPIPDVTTLAGQRIFYSHIDGDGWNNLSEIPAYRSEKTIAAEVIRREILIPYDDVAFTVGLITADVDPHCYAAPQSEQVARDIFALQHIEPASHTHSHPLYWQFFAQYTEDKEKPYLDRYPPPPRHDFFGAWARRALSMDAWAGTPHHNNIAPQQNPSPGRNDLSEAEAMAEHYATPRSYACKPFDLEEEIAGSIARVRELAGGKAVRLVQWSGDTSPFAQALSRAAEAGVYNINGGDSRLDSEYPSYAYVAPVGLRVADQRQIYSSNSNENTYTHLWTGRFFGFRYLKRTIENTESPRRVKPFNLYFHMYSGEKEASLKALKENLDYARAQELTPITASDYAAIANGFYTAQIMPAGELAWDISNRGALSTVRFDDAEKLTVDWSRSQGVIGYRRYQGSLYIALQNDGSATPVTVALKVGADEAEPLPRPILINSRWQVQRVLEEPKGALRVLVAGYGPGDMRWRMPDSGPFDVTITHPGHAEPLRRETVTVGEDRVLTLHLPPHVGTTEMRITKEPSDV